jgi:hypothetical protein
MFNRVEMTYVPEQILMVSPLLAAFTAAWIDACVAPT